ncbi:MAG: hypothetical protein WCS51_03930 [Bacilli bacterium]
MSAKLGTILGIFFIFIAFLFGVDLVMMQYVYTDLDSFSIKVTYDISKNGYLSDELKTNYKTNYGINVYPIEENKLAQSYEEGYLYGYILGKDYSPIVISNSTINLKVKRFAVINAYE